ncbi:MAG: tripartite tricarboxylate transporter substrate binding protein [Pseudomonadota bacterium]
MAAVFLLAGGTAHAQSAPGYPARPVRMVVRFAPGGASDFVGRLIQPRLVQELGQQVVIDNRAGASGNIGVEVAARATPDGYTLLLGNIGTMAINPSIYPKFPIKPVRDFIGVTQVVDVPVALAAHPSVPVKTMKEFIAYAKAQSGKLNYGSAGAGSNGRLEMEQFMRLAGIDLTHIPYKGGAGAAATALVSGEVGVAFVSLASVMPHVRAGKLKILGVSAGKRVAALPDVPVMPELGYKDMQTGSWQGVYVPAGTSRAVVDRLYAAATKVMADPDVVKRINDSGAEVIVSASPAAFAVFMKEQNERFAQVVRQIGGITE